MKFALVFSSIAILAMTTFNLAEACVRHDGACQGPHGRQGDCCGGMYCHKNDPSWAEGRCYNKACVGHDGACRGPHGRQGNCCGDMYCHKNDPSWAEGRCYNKV